MDMEDLADRLLDAVEAGDVGLYSPWSGHPRPRRLTTEGEIVPGYPTDATARPVPFSWRINGLVHPLDLC